MTIAPKLQHFLDQEHAVYELIDHPPTLSSVQSAAVAHIPPSCIAKAVLLEMPGDYLLAVLPSDRRIELADLWDALGDKPRLADEGEISTIFDDCAPGAVPPLGLGYGVPTIIDAHLASEPDIFFEAGDHRSLVHMEQAEFRRLTERARRGNFGTLSSLIA